MRAGFRNHVFLDVNEGDEAWMKGEGKRRRVKCSVFLEHTPKTKSKTNGIDGKEDKVREREDSGQTKMQIKHSNEHSGPWRRHRCFQ